jgi:hypothetical protein
MQQHTNVANKLLAWFDLSGVLIDYFWYGSIHA